MPDVMAASRFSEALERSLDGYTAELGRELEATRARLAGALGTTSSGARVRALARREFDALGERAAQISYEYQGRIAGAVEGYLGSQLETARQFQPDIVSVDDIARELRADERRIAQDVLSGPPMWVNQLETSFLMELVRMRATGEDRQTMMDRLLAVDLVAGRASAARSANNKLTLEADLDFWTMGNALIVAGFERAQKRSRVRFQKQAIAAIDDRTTDCCLRVHGQIQPLNSPFVLTGRPRFADRLQGPPFHWRCRTATSLYTQEMEQVGVPTQAMMDAARSELRARELTGTRARIWPSHATSRRQG